jgi:cephalosporin hydroxylase
VREEASVSSLEQAGLGWADDVTLSAPGTAFVAVFDERSQDLRSQPDRFVLMKSPEMIEWYADRFAPAPPATVLEAGIFKGGSVAFFEELWHPRRLLAFDIASQPVPALTEYIRRQGAKERVKALYGVDQSDRAAVRGAVEEHFGGQPIDLVIDDGCHFLAETRALFSAVFPYVSRGGTYIIEDWAWAHWPGSWQQDGGPYRERPALTSIALELAMLAASRSDLAAAVEVTSAFIVVRRGDGQVPRDFDLSTSYLTAGRVFLEDGFPPPAALGVRGAAGSQTSQRELERQLRAMRQSTSWRITEPMRRLGDYIRSRRH